jgi:hypothetical protein
VDPGLSFKQRGLAAVEKNIPGLAFVLSSWSEGVFDCTTRQHKTHITDAVELLYAWHPWASQLVFVHRTVNKTAEAMFHCSLDSTSAGRLLQIPQWMFDAAAMCGIRPV